MGLGPGTGAAAAARQAQEDSKMAAAFAFEVPAKRSQSGHISILRVRNLCLINLS